MKQKNLKGYLLLLFFMSFAGFLFAQEITIKGVVKEANSGQPLPGVNVAEKGTSNGAVTDFDGNYTIKISNSNSVLVFSYVGFKTLETNVGNNTTVNIDLVEDAAKLDEVVIVGYGTQNRKLVTGSVVSANVKNVMKLPGANAASMLQGQAAGVNINDGQGSPGSEPIIRVRGLGTIGNNNPLVVIDGIPGEMSSVNPADIQSITVLKDASATTIYGSRAANGVIMIQTKRGSEGKLKVELRTYVAQQSLINNISLLGKQDRINVALDTATKNGETPPLWATTPGLPNTNWAEELFSEAYEFKTDVRVSGGSENASYNVSIGHFDQEGTAFNTNYEQFSVRFNADYKFSDKLKLSQSIGFIGSERKLFSSANDNGVLGRSFNVESELLGANVSQSDVLPILRANPTLPGRDSNAPLGLGVPDPVVFPRSQNPLVSQLRDYTTKRDRLQGNLKLDWEITEGLTASTQLGANIFNDFNEDFNPVYPGVNDLFNPKTSLFQERIRRTDAVWNNTLNYEKEVGKHIFGLLAGVSREKRVIESTGGSNTELPSNAVRTLGSGVGAVNSFGSSITSTLQSYFGRLNYAYDEKYLIEASVRRDGSSRFNSDNEYGNFGAVSLGWRMTEESWFDIPFISNFKPRFSWGVLGNQQIPDYLYYALINLNTRANNYPVGDGQIQVGGALASLPSTDIKWEETTTKNYGLDFGFLNETIYGTLDVFNSTTDDMLVSIDPTGTSGITTPYTFNGGLIENKGWELVLGYRHNTGGDFNFNIEGHLSKTSNKIIELGNADDAIIRGYWKFRTHPTTFTAAGGSIGDFYLFDSDGVFQTQAEIDAHGIQPQAEPGDLKFLDVDGDGDLDDDDKRRFGSGLPDFEYGININLNYKKFDLSMFFQGTKGNKMYNAQRLDLVSAGAHTDLLNAWTPDNPSNIYRTGSSNNNNARPSDYFLESASYFRLRNLQIGYTLDELFKNIDLVEGARLYLSGQNLFTITDYTGFDPSLVNHQLMDRGVDRGFVATQRRFVLGLDLRF
ncbi:TonB-dependent receptor [Sabulilitoribacter arenilitoris]|uniref:TonB-dependent receptor n=1 Tax=Wocania arenilitoris TaxID=2044858 RepID=A0AAE3JKH1_9FLAO|nr:TonB-dependent receptor [Wocania arenilitoris]MCF7567052.1 TonB-dependent receptor [Wocania arenilitoris]